MALRKPIVLNSGQLEQLQAGDTLDDQFDGVILTNNNAGAITIGQPVYVAAAGAADLADASVIGTARVIGLVEAASIASSSTGSIQTDGILASADWTAVVGSVNLTSGALYYLSITAGQLSATAPVVVGEFVVEVGQAISLTEMAISIRRTIKL